jgi:hypothetical protein
VDEYFEVPQGLREGSRMSPRLFNVLVNNLAGELEEAGPGVVLGV